MRVSQGQLSVQFDSYPRGWRGDLLVLSIGDKGSLLVGRANLRAACSESRAGLESTIVTPTRHHRGEGRRIKGKQPTDAPVMVTGVMGASRREDLLTQRGRPGGGVGLRLATAATGCRPRAGIRRGR